MKTTADVLKGMDAAFSRKVKQDHEAHASGKEFVRSLCESGRVDGITPDGPLETLISTCLGCGKEISEDDMDCPVCPMGTPQQFTVA